MAVFEQVLELGPEERARVLKRACRADAALRREVETLLAAAATAEGFLEPTGAGAVELLEDDSEEDGERGDRRPSDALGARLQSALGSAYQVHRELGGGGMSRLFLATESVGGRQVVFKLLPPELSSTVDAKRFRREVRLASRLHHPHLVPLLTAGEIEGAFLYYTMPYVEGESLRTRLRRETRLPLQEALGIARDLADVLSYAHAQRVIHRDIKPENILLPHGHAMLTDFGIARALDDGTEARVTQDGYTLGTPSYMSPEHAAGEQVDGRADIYSLGCVLYEMLAGQPPFSGTSLLEVLMQRFGGAPPPLTTLRKDVPRSVEVGVNRALARWPRDRFQTAAEFAGALVG
jgi:serine/threonine-protein kinase